jgi:hypothetical protein
MTDAKLLKLEAIATKAKGEARMARIEAELAEANVETKESLLRFAELAVEHRKEELAEGGVPSTPEPAPTDVSPPQDDPPGASAPPAPSPSPAAGDPPASRPSLVDAPPPKGRARTEWNMERGRELLRERGVIASGELAPLVGGNDAARIALTRLVDAGEAQKTGQRGGTRYHWQERIEDEELSGSTRTEGEGDTGAPVQPPPPPPPPERKAPVSSGPPAERGRGRTSVGSDQEPSFQGLMHQRLIIKPMSIGQMMEEWPGRSEQEIRQALGENMKTGDVTLKRKGSETRYHGRA